MIDSQEQLMRQMAVQEFIYDFGNINIIDTYQHKYGALLALIETQIGFLHKLENPLFDRLTIDACYTEHYLRQQQLFNDIYNIDMQIIFLPDLAEEKQPDHILFDDTPSLIQADVGLLSIHKERQAKLGSSHTNEIVSTAELSEAEHLSPITEDIDSTNIDSKKTTPSSTPKLKTKPVRSHTYIKDWLIFLNTNPKASIHPINIQIRELEEKKRTHVKLTTDEKIKLNRLKATILKDIPIAERTYDTPHPKPPNFAYRKAPYPSPRKRELGSPLSFWQASPPHVLPGKTNTKLPEKAPFSPLQKL